MIGGYSIEGQYDLISHINQSMPAQDSESLLAQHKLGEAEHVLALHNKSPQWNEGTTQWILGIYFIVYSFSILTGMTLHLETQSFVLNFNGRVTQASVKNFQIVHDNDCKCLLPLTCQIFGILPDSSHAFFFQWIILLCNLVKLMMIPLPWIFDIH